MEAVNHFWSFTTEAWGSFKTMLKSTRWVPSMYSRRGMRFMRYALVIYIIANILEQLAIYYGGQLIGGHGTDSPTEALVLLVLIGVSWLGGIGVERLGNRVREWGWNLNDRALYRNITRKTMQKTPGEMLAEDRKVGPYQIESNTMRMHNMQFVVFFNLMSIGATIAVVVGFMLYTDVVAGGAGLLVLAGNLVAIFYLNHHIHRRAKDIDERMRRWKNRLAEYWHNAVYIVATGNELTVMQWLKRAQLPVYLDDYRLWSWYTVIDGVRSAVTNVCLLGILWYSYLTLDTASVVSMFGWLLVFREQFWQIADVQRELARIAEPVHALREDLEQPAQFEQGAFTT